MKNKLFHIIYVWTFLSIFLCPPSYADDASHGIPVDFSVEHYTLIESEESPLNFPDISIEKVSTVAQQNKNLHVSANGLAVWVGQGKLLHDIFYHNQDTTQNITNNKKRLSFNPNVNSLGHITYNDFWGNIYYYDGVNINELPEKRMKYNAKPVINDQDSISWIGSEFRLFEKNKISDIFFYDQEEIEKLTDSNTLSKNHHINASGHMVWQGKTDNSWEIFYYDGTSVKQITNNSYADINPKINDLDQIVFSGFDGEDFEIYLFENSQITAITQNNISDRKPEINNIGQIVWTGYHDKINLPRHKRKNHHKYKKHHKRKHHHEKKHHYKHKYKLTSAEIYLYDAEQITRITNNDQADLKPAINNDGIIVWESYPQKHISRNSEIYFYDGLETYRLTKNNVPDKRPQIGSEHVYWQRKKSGYASIYKGTLPLKSNYKVPASALRLFLKLDNDFTDSSNIHSPLVFGPSIDQNEFVIGEGSVSFNGTSDRLALSSVTAGATDIFNSTTDNATVSFWVKHNTTSGLQAYLVRGGSIFDVISGNSWGIGLDGTNNQMVFILNNAINGQYIETHVPVEDLNGAWHHIAIVRVQNKIGIYLNGQIIYYDEIQGAMSTSSDFRIGYENLRHYFNGNMDDILISKSNPFNALPDQDLTNTFELPESGFIITAE